MQYWSARNTKHSTSTGVVDTSDILSTIIELYTYARTIYAVLKKHMSSLSIGIAQVNLAVHAYVDSVQYQLVGPCKYDTMSTQLSATEV